MKLLQQLLIESESQHTKNVDWKSIDAEIKRHVKRGDKMSQHQRRNLAYTIDKKIVEPELRKAIKQNRELHKDNSTVLFTTGTQIVSAFDKVTLEIEKRISARCC